VARAIRRRQLWEPGRSGQAARTPTPSTTSPTAALVDFLANFTGNAVNEKRATASCPYQPSTSAASRGSTPVWRCGFAAAGWCCGGAAAHDSGRRGRAGCRGQVDLRRVPGPLGRVAPRGRTAEPGTGTVGSQEAVESALELAERFRSPGTSGWW